MTRLKSCVIVRFQVSYARKAIDFRPAILPIVQRGYQRGAWAGCRPDSALSVGYAKLVKRGEYEDQLAGAVPCTDRRVAW